LQTGLFRSHVSRLAQHVRQNPSGQDPALKGIEDPLSTLLFFIRNTSPEQDYQELSEAKIDETIACTMICHKQRIQSEHGSALDYLQAVFVMLFLPSQVGFVDFVKQYVSAPEVLLEGGWIDAKHLVAID